MWYMRLPDAHNCDCRNRGNGGARNDLISPSVENNGRNEIFEGSRISEF